MSEKSRSSRLITNPVAAILFAMGVLLTIQMTRHSATAGVGGWVFVTDHLFGVVWHCTGAGDGSVCARVYPPKNVIN